MSESTTTPTKHLFFVYAPDKTEEGTFERRLAARPKHLELAAKNVASKFTRVGGPLLTPESLEPGAQKKMIGSTMIFEAESIEEVRKVIENDPYYVTGVWDPEKLVILPFIAATPLP
ncbi:hypothetical protein AX16_010647 [Volvariella volvacea WC 439]|nr:hypothetical protein AX16_010647 [Volvariella volvacea WC 439]